MTEKARKLVAVVELLVMKMFGGSFRWQTSVCSFSGGGGYSFSLGGGRDRQVNSVGLGGGRDGQVDSVGDLPAYREHKVTEVEIASGLAGWLLIILPQHVQRYEVEKHRMVYGVRHPHPEHLITTAYYTSSHT